MAADKTQAVAFFEKSCAGHNALGCANLADLLYAGDGVPRDEKRGPGCPSSTTSFATAFRLSFVSDAYPYLSSEASNDYQIDLGDRRYCAAGTRAAKKSTSLDAEGGSRLPRLTST
jgi:hypothetical protein